MDYFPEEPLTVQLERTSPTIQPWLIVVSCDKCGALVQNDKEHRDKHMSYHRGWWEKTDD